MKEETVLQELAEIILSEAKDKAHDALVTNAIHVGHFNGSIFNPRKMFHRTAPVFIRFLLNIAAQVGEKKFKDMMNRFADALWKIADNNELIEEINNAHASLKNKHYERN